MRPIVQAFYDTVTLDNWGCYSWSQVALEIRKLEEALNA